MSFNRDKTVAAEERCKMDDLKMKHGFYRVELNKTVWEVPDRYTNLSPVGSGAYGQVW